jgi:hypothetical protein
MGIRSIGNIRIIKKNTAAEPTAGEYHLGESFQRIHARNFTSSPMVNWDIAIDKRDWDALLAGVQRLISNPMVFVPFEVPGRGREKNVLLTTTFDRASADWNYELLFHRHRGDLALIDGIWFNLAYRGSAEDRMEIHLDPARPGTLTVVPDDSEMEDNPDFVLPLHRSSGDVALLRNFLLTIADPDAEIFSKTIRKQ